MYHSPQEITITATAICFCFKTLLNVRWCNVFNCLSGVFSAFGCPADEIQVSCPSNKTIFINNADYGQNKQACGEGTCCPPNPLDCTQDMAESTLDEWVQLKLRCDNRTECSYLFQGSTFTDGVCAPADSVAYLEIDYNCLPGISAAENYVLLILNICF